MEASKDEGFIFFMRHGETDPNKQRKWQGKIDDPLNDEGRKQVALCGPVFKKIITDSGLVLKKIFSSPQKRAVETASYITREFDLPLIKRGSFREINHGVCEGLTHSEVKEKYPEVWIRYKTDKAKLWFPEGESVLQVYDRVKQEMENILMSLENDCILIVSHGASISLSIIALLKLPVTAMNSLGRMANTSISIVKIFEQKCSLITYNWLPHIEQANGGKINIKELF